MFSFFKRSANAEVKPLAVSGARKSPPARRQRFVDAIPVPDVVEGSEDSDWSLWEESVSFQDSQMSPEPVLSARPPARGAAQHPQTDLIDPFSSVHRKSG